MPRTVLLADDSVTAQNMGRRILTDAGYEVITVNNGSAALKKIHEVRPDLIVLDVYMPGYGGLEVCQRLKESADTMRIPVLLTVGKMEPFKANEAKRVRADAHIVKPFEASELLAALAKLEDRIVPQAEPSRGRKSKKPSFWHDDEGAAQRSGAENSQGQPQAKGTEDPELSAEAVGAAKTEPAPNVGAFPLVPEATGEMPVIADSMAVTVSEEEAGGPVKAASGSLAPAIETGSNAPAEVSSGNATSVEASQSASVESAPLPSSLEASSKVLEPKAEPVGVSRWVAENVALSPEEAAVELENEMRAAECGSAKAVPESAPVSVSTEISEPKGAAFAAAAGADGVSTTAVSAEEPESSVTPEAVAAWQNWQQIRDTVMNAHNTMAVAESAAQAEAALEKSAEPPATAPEESAERPSNSDSSQSSDLEAGALSSIVDTMLAELKPKLMEEIAKKLKK